MSSEKSERDALTPRDVPMVIFMLYLLLLAGGLVLQSVKFGLMAFGKMNTTKYINYHEYNHYSI